MASHRNEELERAILDDVLDPDAWLVYGDWLQSAGDPRGELVAVQARLARDPGNASLMEAQRAFFRRHARTLLEGLEPYLTNQPMMRFSWEFGFLWTASVTTAGHAAAAVADGLRVLLDHPSARFLHALTIASPSDGNWTPIVAAIDQRDPPLAIRLLYLGDALSTEAVDRYAGLADPVDVRPSTMPFGSLSGVWRSAPRLRTVVLRGGTMNLGDLDLPDLRELVIETACLDPANIRSVLQTRRTELEDLELWFGGPRCSCTATDVEALLETANLPALRRLAIKNCAFVDVVCTRVGAGRLTRQLRALDLSLGTLTRAGMEALVASRAALAHLHQLDVCHHFAGRWDEELESAVRSLAAFVDVDEPIEDENEPNDYDAVEDLYFPTPAPPRVFVV